MQLRLHHCSPPWPNRIAAIILTAADLIGMIANSEAENVQATHEETAVSFSLFKARAEGAEAIFR